MSRYIHRQKVGKSFRYFHDDQQITDMSEIERINSLAIPPAWQDVQIALSQSAKVQATGFDKNGRKQAIYSPAFRAKQEKAKFERIVSFAEHLPAMRRQSEKDLARKKFSKEKVLACIVKLMDEAYFRVGNDTYAKQHHTYGITTLRSKHADITTTSVTFNFVGKSGQEHTKKINDKQLVRIIRQLDDLPGYELFKYIDDDGNLHHISSTDVNSYIKQHMGTDFTAKDFRTWGGTLLATAELIAIERADSERERKKILTSCVKKVARRLGNTPAVARASYIDPRIIDTYLHTDTLHNMHKTIADMRGQKYLKPEEHCVLALLRQTSK